MKRVQAEVRPDFTQQLESIGMNYHTHDNGEPYWCETAYYQFSEQEILKLEAATNELQRLCIETVGDLIERKDLTGFQIPTRYWPMVFESWERDEVSIYGRFDLAYSPSGDIKMLEYNADTPTSLIEASLAQWHWIQNTHQNSDQWNSLHERLVEAWKRAKDFCSIYPMHFLGLDTPEDWQTTTYMRDVAEQAGWQTHQCNMLDIGWDMDRKCFIDLDGQPIRNAFKLYPWEHMVREEFGPHLTNQPRPVTFLEPAWKMILSNKAILAKLWERYPNHPNLLPAYLTELPLSATEYVKKPIYGREGADIQIVNLNHTIAGDVQGYGEEGFVYQQKAQIQQFTESDHTITPILGAWVVDGEAAGMGIRESDRYITDNRSRFVPHLIG